MPRALYCSTSYPLRVAAEFGPVPLLEAGTRTSSIRQNPNGIGYGAGMIVRGIKRERDIPGWAEFVRQIGSRF